MSKRLALIFIVLFTALAHSALPQEYPSQQRLLLINSYHKGYVWSDIITQTIVDHFSAKAPKTVTIKIAYMDTKRNNSEEFKHAAGLEVKRLIESFKPDIIIGSDDNAAKYVIKPYFLDQAIPFVFCGLNDEPAVYGFNGNAVTGIREIDLIIPLYNHLKGYARGSRVGYIAADKDVQRTMAAVNQRQLGQEYSAIYFIKDFSQWKESFLRLQEEADILLMQDVCIVPDWDQEEAERFVLEHATIPSGTTTDLQERITLMGIFKSAKEHGHWAAEAALKIIRGTPAETIPITINKKGSLCLNLLVAEKLNVVFSPSLLRAAETIIDTQ